MKKTHIILTAAMALFFGTAFSQSNLKSSIAKHNRQIVFSNKPIDAGVEEGLISESRIGEPIFLRFYMDSTIKQFIAKWKYSNSPEQFRYFMISFSLDGEFKWDVHLETKDFKENMNSNSYGSANIEHPFVDTYHLSEQDKLKVEERLKAPNFDFCPYVLKTVQYYSKASEKEKDHNVKIDILMSDNHYYYQKYASGTILCKADKRGGLEKAGVTNVFHKEHVKQIIFSSKPIDYDVKKEDLVNEYGFGDVLYYRAFLDNTAEGLLKKNNLNDSRIYFKYFLDGKEISKGGKTGKDGYINIQKQEETSVTTFAGQFFTNKKEELDKIEVSFKELLYRTTNTLSGSHTLKIEAWIGDRSDYYKDYYKEIIATGEITLKAKPVDKSHPAFSFTEPKVALVDPVLEKKLMDVFNEHWNGEIVATKAFLRSKEWTMAYNANTGAIVAKDFFVIFLLKSAKGCYYACQHFCKSYEGAGKYGSIWYKGPAYSDVDMPGSGNIVPCK